MIRLYHWIMNRYYGWRKRRLVRQLRELGREKGLPSLDAWTDDEVAEGFVRMMVCRELSEQD